MSDAENPKRYFMSKLLPPRPSFPFDMSEAEREVMQRHVAYWTGLLEQGRAILFGRSATPKARSASASWSDATKPRSSPSKKATPRSAPASASNTKSTLCSTS